MDVGRAFIEQSLRGTVARQTDGPGSPIEPEIEREHELGIQIGEG